MPVGKLNLKASRRKVDKLLDRIRTREISVDDLNAVSWMGAGNTRVSRWRMVQRFRNLQGGRQRPWAGDVSKSGPTLLGTTTRIGGYSWSLLPGPPPTT